MIATHRVGCKLAQVEAGVGAINRIASSCRSAEMVAERDDQLLDDTAQHTGDKLRQYDKKTDKDNGTLCKGIKCAIPRRWKTGVEKIISARAQK